MTPVTLRAMSASAGAPATKSGSAIGIGCTLPCVMSRRTHRARRTRRQRGKRAGAGAEQQPAAVHEQRAARNADVGSTIDSFMVSTHVLASAAEHVARIEVDFDVFPGVVVLRLEHVVRAGLRRPRAPRCRAPALKSGPLPLVEHRRRRAQLCRRCLSWMRMRITKSCGFCDADRRIPQRHQPRAQRVDLRSATAARRCRWRRRASAPN